MELLRTIRADVKLKARWTYNNSGWKAILKTLCADGTAAMILYRLMQGSRRLHLEPLAMLFNKLNAVFCQCIIGRGAEFGRGFVLVHSQGVVINSAVRGGEQILIEHQVTIGAERNSSPVLGNNVFVGAGAKIIGAVVIGDGARIGANAVVVDDVAAYTTVVGIPARPVKQRSPDDILDTLSAAEGG
jgi:serine O-acetyltransferase